MDLRPTRWQQGAQRFRGEPERRFYPEHWAIAAIVLASYLGAAWALFG